METRSSAWFALLVGFVSFAVIQALWLIARPYLNEYSMWVFETTAGVAIGGVILFATCGWMGYRSSTTTNRMPIALFCGAAAGMAVAIVWLLPLLGQTSNIWPIALIFNWILLLPLVYLGWALGLAWRTRSMGGHGEQQARDGEA